MNGAVESRVFDLEISLSFLALLSRQGLKTMASQIHDSPLHNGEQNGEHKQQQQQEEEAARSSASGPESVVVVVDSPYFVASDAPQASKKRKLPAMLDHFNQRDLKNLFKCSIAVWINTILIFINPTLSVLGQAAFFGK